MQRVSLGVGFVLALVVGCSRKPKETAAAGAARAAVVNAPASAATGIAPPASASPTRIKAPVATPIPAPDPTPPGSLCRFQRAVTGTLGKATLYMRLHGSGATVDGSYFYASHATDLTITGKLRADSGFKLDEAYKGKTTGHFEGTCRADGHLLGTWTRPDGGGAIPFDLAPVNGTPDGKLLVFTKSKSRSYPARRRAEDVSADRVVWPAAERCTEEVAYPDVFGAKTSEAEAAINRALHLDKWNFEAEEMKACRLGERGQGTQGFDVRVNEPGIFVVEMFGSGDGEGTAHPYQWANVYAFDTSTGKPFARDDILAGGAAARKATDALFAQCLTAEYDKEILPMFVGPDATCGMIPTAKGVQCVAGDVPEVMRGMRGDGPTVTYAALLAAKALRPDSPSASLWKDVKPDSTAPCVASE